MDSTLLTTRLTGLGREAIGTVERRGANRLSIFSHSAQRKSQFAAAGPFLSLRKRTKVREKEKRSPNEPALEYEDAAND